MVTLFGTALAVLCFSLTASAAPTERMIEARKPDHWGSIVWGDISLGTCGYTGGNNDFVTAVSPLLFDNEHPCGRTMIITYGDNNVVVEVVDRCADCADNDLVLSPAAFRMLIGRKDIDGENITLINATWDFQPSAQC